VLDLCTTKIRDGICASEIVQPDLILLSIGGNDANFGDVVKKTLFSEISMVENGQQRLIPTERERLKSAITRLKSNYDEMADAISLTFPNSPVVVTNYLNPLHASQTQLCTGDEGGGFFSGLLRPLTSFLNIKATTDELIALQRDFIQPMLGEQGIAGLAKRQTDLRPHQWHFVSTSGTDHSGNQINGLAANGICLGDNFVAGRWFNRVADTNTDRPEISGTAHPNIFGQLLFTRTVYPTFQRLLNYR